MKRFLSLILVVVLGAFVLVGCASKGSEERLFQVGFVNLADSDPNCYQATQTFKKIVESDEFKNKIGSDKQVKVLTADSDGDIAKQTANVETLLAKGVDMLFIIGVDTAGNSTAVKAANQAGVPVFMVATESKEGDYKFVGFNELEFGQRQGQWVVENLEQGAKILYLGGTPGREASIAREKGALDVIKKERPDIKILGNQAADFSNEKAMKVTEDWIQQYGGDFDAIIAADNKMAGGSIEALKAANLVGKVKVVGTITPGTWDAEFVKNGEMSYGVYVSFKVLGELCADVAEKVYKGEDVPKVNHMEMFDVTKETYSKYFK